jgi:3-deoxy-D-manno-octulosonate 8-phosphate phosphatase (KDO 8-P phosphatase)
MTHLKYIILDVDGTLTDGGIYYDELGNELKKFCTKDAAGIIVARVAGIEVVVLTGRECVATTRRLTELGVKEIHQNVKNKVSWIKTWMEKNRIEKYQIGYIGDDLNDLVPMKLCGYIGCPADACAEVKSIADYVSIIKGGYGAVRDIIEHYFREVGLWDGLVEKAYGAGI